MRSERTFSRITCGVDGSAAALEGARQAAVLAGADASVELVAVVNDDLLEVDVRAGIEEGCATDALAQARAELADAGTYVATRTVLSQGRFVWDKLLEIASGADLLVLGRRELARPLPLARSQTVVNVLERTAVPVLCAVAPPPGRDFPGRILVAADGPGHPEDAVRLATGIADRAGGDVVLVRAAHSESPIRGAVASAVAELRERVGAPIEVVADGSPAHVVVEYAARERASLVICGGRGKLALRRLRSVSARVATAAPCSVLVVPTGQPDEQNIPYA